MDKGILPKASFVVNSGTGLHMYYILSEPAPMYPQNQHYLVGHRYHGVMTLAIYAKKCGIEEAELRQDAYNINNEYNIKKVLPHENSTFFV